MQFGDKRVTIWLQQGTNPATVKSFSSCFWDIGRRLPLLRLFSFSAVRPAPHRRYPASCAKKSRPADMCRWTGHRQGNLPLRVCEAARPSARFSSKFCPQGNIRGKEFLTCAAGRNGFPLKCAAKRLAHSRLKISLVVSHPYAHVVRVGRFIWRWRAAVVVQTRGGG